jgi:hypothetical protein
VPRPGARSRKPGFAGATRTLAPQRRAFRLTGGCRSSTLH